MLNNFRAAAQTYSTPQSYSNGYNNGNGAKVYISTPGIYNVTCKSVRFYIDKYNGNNAPCILLDFVTETGMNYTFKAKINTDETKKIKFWLDALLNMLAAYGRGNVSSILSQAKDLKDLAENLDALVKESNTCFNLRLVEREFNGKKSIGVDLLNPPYVVQ